MPVKFVCFIQRNDIESRPILLPHTKYSNLIDYYTYAPTEEISLMHNLEPSWDAVIVEVPDTYTLHDIFKFPPKKFLTFPQLNAEFNIGDGSFTTSDGAVLKYGEAILDENFNFITENYSSVLDDDGTPINKYLAAWKCEDKPGVWLVNFEKSAFDLFVLHDEPKVIYYFCYRIILENENNTYIHDKKAMFEYIQDRSHLPRPEIARVNDEKSLYSALEKDSIQGIIWVNPHYALQSADLKRNLDEYITRILQHMNIAYLDLAAAPISDNACTLISESKNLTTLILDEASISDDGIQKLAQSPTLTDISLPGRTLYIDNFEANDYELVNAMQRNTVVNKYFGNCIKKVLRRQFWES